MPPQAISLILLVLQELITHEPEIAAEVKALFTKADPTDADWQALHDKVAAKSYRDYVPGTALPITPLPGQGQTAPILAVTPVTAPAPAVSAGTAAPDGSALSAGTPVPIIVLPTPPPGPSQPAPRPATEDKVQAIPAPTAPAAPAPAPKAVGLNVAAAGRETSLGNSAIPRPAPIGSDSGPSQTSNAS